MKPYFKVYPAIDIQDGKCVRLEQGKFNRQKVYSIDPVEVADSFEKAGFTCLHLVDLDGAKKGALTNWDAIESITSQTKLNVDVGGGIKTLNDISKLLNMGVRQVNLGSIAYKNPEQVKHWIKTFNSQIILSADVHNYEVAISGWQENTGLQIKEYLQPFIDGGLHTVTSTDISRDGMLQGPGFDLYKYLTDLFPTINIIASGGVRNIRDLEKLQGTGCAGCIVGKAFYEGNLKIAEIPKKFL